MPASISFADRLADAVRRKKTPAMVGLDPRYESLPKSLRERRNADDWSARAEAYKEFCCGLIDVVAPLVPAVKPQAAFFEELGPVGATVLAEIISYARGRDLLVVLDAKRGDIGTSAEAYARGYISANGPWRADALTVNPYLGDDSLQPFIEIARANHAGVFVLVKTSNPGGAQFQDLFAAHKPIYRHVALHVQTLAAIDIGQSGFGTTGAVVGATYPDQLSELREVMDQSWLLIPGYGSQGGTARDVAAGFRQDGLGAIVNNSRGIIFAHARPEYRDRFGEQRWQGAVEAATRDMIDELSAETAAGALIAGAQT